MEKTGKQYPDSVKSLVDVFSIHFLIVDKEHTTSFCLFQRPLAGLWQKQKKKKKARN